MWPGNFVNVFPIPSFEFPEYGVFACRHIKKGEFIAVYKGELLSKKEGEKKFDAVDVKEIRSYFYFFEYKTKQFWYVCLNVCFTFLCRWFILSIKFLLFCLQWEYFY